MRHLASGEVRPARGKLSVAELALAMYRPERTVRYWLAIWRAAKVPGIDVVQLQGSASAYVVDRSLLTRWRAGRLPAPRAATLAHAA